MKWLSRCTDGEGHVFDIRLLDVAGALSDLIHIKCRYCNISWSDILDELERREEWSEAEEAGIVERDCGV